PYVAVLDVEASVLDGEGDAAGGAFDGDFLHGGEGRAHHDPLVPEPVLNAVVAKEDRSGEREVAGEGHGAAEVDVRKQAQGAGQRGRDGHRLEQHHVLNGAQRAHRRAERPSEKQREDQRQQEERRHRQRHGVVGDEQGHGDVLDGPDRADAPLAVEAEVEQTFDGQQKTLKNRIYGIHKETYNIRRDISQSGSYLQRIYSLKEQSSKERDRIRFRIERLAIETEEKIDILNDKLRDKRNQADALLKKYWKFIEQFDLIE
ncbi:hypothetical protein LCGC14_2812110, partial [marine sediment metagenome]